MIRAACGYGSGSNRIGLTALKIAVRRADAERQRHDGDRGEAGAAAQPARGVAQIGEQRCRPTFSQP